MADRRRQGDSSCRRFFCGKTKHPGPDFPRTAKNRSAGLQTGFYETAGCVKYVFVFSFVGKFFVGSWQELLGEIHL
ncbi:MAG: hypothetical protein ABSA42_18090, partial [Terracidiphilus sp.]